MKIPYESISLIGGMILLATVPVFNIASDNFSYIIWTDFFTALSIVIGISGTLLSAVYYFTGGRISIVLAIGLGNWLFSYTPEADKIIRALGASWGFEVASGISFVLLFPVPLIFLSLLPREFVTRAVGATGLALFSLAAVPLILAQAKEELSSHAAQAEGGWLRSPLPELSETKRNLPDIVYIVPDRYGSESVLNHAFQHDNSEFIAALRNRGFSVPSNSRANYLRTRDSLASSLNMQYLTSVHKEMHEATESFEPLYSLIRNNLVAKRLKSMGYRYVHVSSSWDGTRSSVHSDINVNFPGTRVPGGEFGRAVAARSIAFIFAVTLLGETGYVHSCEILKSKLKFLEEVGGQSRPTFTFAHIMAPHTPILTDSKGNCIDPIDYPVYPRNLTWQQFKNRYSGYVDYINKQLLKIFDRQKNDNPNPTIFIIQSDEGPYPQDFRQSQKDDSIFDWHNASGSDLYMKFGIMSAIYFSRKLHPRTITRIPNDLTPVNTWRIIFSALESQKYPMLPNRYFIYPNRIEPFNSIEITNRIKSIRK